MNDASFASLSSTLLARKGGAKPAMRPQLAASLAAAAAGGKADISQLDDLGWNDMGDDEDEPSRESDVLQLTPEPVNELTAAEAREMDREANVALSDGELPEVVRQQEELAERWAAPAELHKEAKKPLWPAPEPANLDDDAGEAETTLDRSDDDWSFPADQAPPPVPAPAPAPVPVSRPVPLAASAAPLRPRGSALSRGARAAFTLRLDADRHLKLRLAATLKGRSAQSLVTEALDALLADMPELETLAAQVKRR